MGDGGQVTAADYAWLDGGSRLSEVYRLTWVAGLSPEAVADRLDGRTVGEHRWPDGAWDHVPGPGRDETVLAATR